MASTDDWLHGEDGLLAASSSTALPYSWADSSGNADETPQDNVTKKRWVPKLRVNADKSDDDQICPRCRWKGHSATSCPLPSIASRSMATLGRFRALLVFAWHATGRVEIMLL
eukprot:TRINITY_DN60952_c0_g1_i1.p1 TRINITY_DN60952_c0_g1~~TRINITY_DN60952_c0_g1_i1.p1  ORF type:complete len:129 (+),score=6.01 TRINITY_DN60952_c0_g1_i1:49-387(+)